MAAPREWSFLHRMSKGVRWFQIEELLCFFETYDILDLLFATSSDDAWQPSRVAHKATLI
jgi:hypothetical protein